MEPAADTLSSEPSGRAPRAAMAGLWELSLPFVSAILLSLSFPPYDLNPLAYVALVPLGLLLVRQLRIEHYVAIYFGAMLAQLLGTDWVRTSYGGSGLSGPRAYAWFLMAQLLALPAPLAFWLGRRLFLRARFAMWVVLPVTWVGYEFARYWWGYVLTETPYPWLQLGTTQAERLQVIQIADLGGVWAVSALVALVNGAAVVVFLQVAQRDRPAGILRGLAMPAIVVACVVGYGSFRLAQSDRGGAIVVGLVPENQPADGFSMGWDRPGKNKKPALRIDLLLWSELSDLNGLVEREAALAVEDLRWVALRPRAEERIDELEKTARRTGCALVVGMPSSRIGIAGKKIYNSLALVSPAEGYLGCYNKTCLIPHGEFTPRLALPGLDRQSAGYTRGAETPILSMRGSDGGTIRVGAAICFDTCFAGFFGRYMRRAAPEMFAVASCESADRGGSLQLNMLRHARLRAVECRRPIVRNVIDGFSGWIDSRGRTGQQRREPIETIEPCGPVRANSETSCYAVCGDWLPLGCIALLVIGGPGGITSRRRVAPCAQR